MLSALFFMVGEESVRHSELNNTIQTILQISINIISMPLTEPLPPPPCGGTIAHTPAAVMCDPG